MALVVFPGGGVPGVRRVWGVADVHGTPVLEIGESGAVRKTGKLKNHLTFESCVLYYSACQGKEGWKMKKERNVCMRKSRTRKDALVRALRRLRAHRCVWTGHGVCKKIRQSQDHDIRTSTDEMNGVQMGEMPGTHIGFSKIPDGGLDSHDRSGKTSKTR